jgi:4,5-dihydroxyphthalate decarboxylase
VLKAFIQSKEIALAHLADTSASKVMLPFVDEQFRDAQAWMGKDFWSYGVEPNRKALDTFLRRHHAEGLSSRLVAVDELFHPSTLESFAI